MRILFDLDNTVYDLLGGLEELFPMYSREHQETYSFSGIKTLDADDVYSLFNEPSFFYGLKPYNGVLELIEFIKMEHEVIFYSNCNPEVAEAKLRRLKEDLSFEPELYCYDNIKDIPKIEYDLLVDDYKEKVAVFLEETPNIKVIMQEHMYNKGLDNSNVVYIDPLSETYIDDFFSALEQLGLLKTEEVV